MASYTSNVTSGVSPFAVSFQDTTSDSPTGWAWFFGDETWTNGWTQQTASAGWTARYLNSAVALPNGSIVIMGGSSSSYQNDTWLSTNMGATWTKESSNAEWQPRGAMATIATPNGSIVMMGGTNGIRNNETWISVNAGTNWTKVNASSVWYARSGNNAVTLSDGSIVMMGGWDGANYFNDVWRSTNNGSTWVLQTASPGWSARHDFGTVVLPGDRIIISGGVPSGSLLNDTWQSTNKGVTWTQLSASAGYTARYSQGMVAMPDNSIYLIGGYSSTYLNDTWRSINNGTTFSLTNSSSGWIARRYAQSVVLPNSTVVMMGGNTAGPNYNDAWSLSPQGSTSQNPTHTYTGTVGQTFNVSEQAYNNAGFSNAVGTGYITVSGAITPSFTMKSSSGTGKSFAALTDTSLNATAWIWSYTNVTGNNTPVYWSTLKNPTQIFGAGNWSISVNASNAGAYGISAAQFLNVSAISTAFSGIPLFGTSPFTSTFTDASTGNPTGWAWFFGDENYTQGWNQQSSSPGWQARTNPATVVLPNGSIILTGGVGGPSATTEYGDVWESNDKGATWTEINASPGWTARDSHAMAILPDGNVILTGGQTAGSRTNDTWRSTDGGLTWTQMNASGSWLARYGHSMVALQDGNLVLMAGTWWAPETWLNDTWKSTDEGAHWSLVNFTPAFMARQYANSEVMPDGSIILLGGAPTTTFPAAGGYIKVEDVWRSVDEGNIWTQQSTNSFPYRTTSGSVVMPDGSLVVSGGWNGTVNFNDTWKSTDYGKTWSMVNASSGWPIRNSQSEAVLPDGSIVLMAGFAGGSTTFNDTWRMQPAGSNLQNPTHTYTGTVGQTFNVSEQAYNSAAGPNALILNNYISISNTSSPVSSFTMQKTTGWAKSLVTFTDTSLYATGWQWTAQNVTGNNTLFTFSTTENPVQLFGVGNFSIVLNATATGGNSYSAAQFLNISATIPTFSGTPMFGAAPLTTTFTDASTGSPSTYAWFFGDENYTQGWSEQTASAGWTSRYSSSAVTLADGTIVLIGGHAVVTIYNDTWNSTDKGATWTQVNASAAFPARYYQSAVAMPDGSIVLMGGVDGSVNYYNDVWRSLDKGNIWSLINASAGWSDRGRQTVTLMADGSLILAGGHNGTAYLNDVWRSTDDGAHWTQQTASASWGIRASQSANAMPDGSIVLMGGLNGGYLNDVWRSTDKGATWSQVNASAGWTARWGQSSNTMPDGSIVLMGGRTPAYQNDVWRSTNNGVTWMQVNASAGWTGRNLEATTVIPDGSIVLMGGFPPTNEVWRFQPAGSNTASPVHSYANVGTYSVSEMVNGAFGGSVLTKSSYITVLSSSPTITAAFIGSPRNGTAPLTVSFLDLTSGNLAANQWDWGWGDGTTNGTTQNPAHTYTGTGFYTVYLNVTNTTYGVSSKTSISAYIGVGIPVPAFSANITYGGAGQAIQFTDASTGSPTIWNWTFGDGNVSTAHNPLFVYNIPGTYSVNLTASNIYGNASLVKTNYIQINATGYPFASFTANPTAGAPGLAVSFTDTSIQGKVAGETYNWSFGDVAGTTPYSSVNTSTVHVYAYAGTFTPTLTITNSIGTSTFVGPLITISTAQSQTTFYVPQNTRIIVVDEYGKPLSGVAVTAVPLNFTAPNNWTQTLIGIQPMVNITGTTMFGWSSTDGSIVFPVLPSINYQFTFSSASLGVSNQVTFYPIDTSYIIYCPTTGQGVNKGMQRLTALQNSTLYVTQNTPLNTLLTWNLLYTDPTGYTTALTWNVTCWNNMTTVYSKSWGAIGSTVTIADNFSFPTVPKGMEYRAEYVATRNVP